MMIRQLDLTSLRSFVTVHDAGGVTRAAGFLNLTQSAVSMQLRRLEDSLGVELMERSGRGITLTAAGEQLLGHARRMLQLNDEVLARFAGEDWEGEIVLGVPADVVYPAIPMVLRRFAQEYPKMRIKLISTYTSVLKAMYAQGECDVILTTEDQADAGGQTLRSIPLIWVGAPGGHAWKARPLPLAFEYKCIFRARVQAALDQAGIPWVMATESETTRSIEASLAADLAVHALVQGAEPREIRPISHGGQLPDLGLVQVNLYAARTAPGSPLHSLVAMIRQEHGATADEG